MRQQHTSAHQPASRTLLANRVRLCVREEKRMCSLLATPSQSLSPPLPQTQRLLERGTRTPLDARRGKRWGSDAQARPHRMRCSPTNMHTLCTLLFTATRMRKDNSKEKGNEVVSGDNFTSGRTIQNHVVFAVHLETCARRSSHNDRDAANHGYNQQILSRKNCHCSNDYS